MVNNYEFNKSQSFIGFPVTSFFISSIHFAAHFATPCTLPPGNAAPPPPQLHHV